MKVLGDNSKYANVIAFMKDEKAESDLSDHEKQLVTRWNEAFTLLRNYNSTSDAVAILMKRFPGLSRATAYRDCANAVSLFGDINKSSKEGIRHLATELIKDSAIIARAKNNEDGLRKAGESMAKVNGVNLADPDQFDWSQVEPHTYELGVDDKTLKALRIMLQGGKIDLSNIVDAMNNMAEEIPYTDAGKDDGTGESNSPRQLP